MDDRECPRHRGGTPLTDGDAHPTVRLREAALSFGERRLWSGLDLDVTPGEFLAVLGPNGAGKTSLLRVLLGEYGASGGTVEVAGGPVRRGLPGVGYVPQQRTLTSGAPLRGRDLVGLGVDGRRPGLGIRGAARRHRLVDAALAQVGGEALADRRIDELSGGEQQRLRIAQAIAGDPRLLLCDEPLLSLDMGSQRRVVELLDRRRRMHDTAIVFVTHEINPVLPFVDRVLYLVDGRFRVGAPREVMTSRVLSELYGMDIEVLEVRGRLVVVGTGDVMDATAATGRHPHHPEEGHP